MEQLTLMGGTSKTTISKHESHKLHHAFTVSGRKTLITFAGALVTGNVINAMVDGEAIAAVTFATDNDTTMQLLAASIAAMPKVKSATVVLVAAAVTNDRVIEVISTERAHYNSITSVVVTGGAGQTTAAITTSDSAIKLGMPVELNATTGKLQPLTAATASTTMIGIAMFPNEADEECTVMCRGMAIVETECSGAVTPGPVAYAGYNATTQRVKVTSSAVTATNIIGWATVAGADTEIIDTIIK